MKNAATAGHHTLELSEGSARGGLLIEGWVSFQSAKWASFQPALTAGHVAGPYRLDFYSFRDRQSVFHSTPRYRTVLSIFVWPNSS